MDLNAKYIFLVGGLGQRFQITKFDSYIREF